MRTSFGRESKGAVHTVCEARINLWVAGNTVGSLTTCAIPQRSCDEVASYRGAISSVPYLLPFMLLDLLYMYAALCVSVCKVSCVCPLITRERVGRLSPNFQGSFRALRGWFSAQKWG